MSNIGFTFISSPAPWSAAVPRPWDSGMEIRFHIICRCVRKTVLFRCIFSMPLSYTAWPVIARQERGASTSYLCRAGSIYNNLFFSSSAYVGRSTAPYVPSWLSRRSQRSRTRGTATRLRSKNKPWYGTWELFPVHPVSPVSTL